MKRKAITNNRLTVDTTVAEAAIDEHLMGHSAPELGHEVRMALAYRLAAEAVASAMLVPGLRPQRITLVNRQKAFGHVFSKNQYAGKEVITAREVFIDMVKTYSELLAEQRVMLRNLLPVKNYTDLLTQLAELLTAHFDLGSGEEHALATSLQEVSGSGGNRQLDIGRKTLLDMAKQAAGQLLTEYWPEVEIIAGELLQKGASSPAVLGVLPTYTIDVFSLIPDASFRF